MNIRLTLLDFRHIPFGIQFLKKNLSLCLAIFFLASNFGIFADNLTHTENVIKQPYQQWFTGPILTPTPITMPVGHPGLEVACLVGETYGYYNSQWHVDSTPSIWSTGPYVDFQIGFNKFLGAEYIGALLTNFSQGAHYTHLVDSIFRFGFQILTDQNNSWIPDFRILLQETVPTGKYQKLNPNKQGTDVTGQGSFQTGIHFAFQKLFHPIKNHDFRLRWTFGYFVPASVHVRGFNYLGEVLRLREQSIQDNIFQAIYVGNMLYPGPGQFVWNPTIK